MPPAIPDATSATSKEARIAAAVEHWAGQLIDLSRRNNLLFFKDLKTGTLDLADADEGYKDRLLAGQSVRASRLYTTPEAFQSARRRLTEIKRKMRLLSEERGIDAGFVAAGMLSWQAPQSGRAVAATRSPVLLRSLKVQSKGLNAADFELLLEDSAELNPVLSYALARQVGVNIAGVAESIEQADVRQQLTEAVKLIQQRAADAGVATSFESKLVAAVFAYEKLPMVRDLEESTRLLASHPITCALARDPEACAELQRRPEPSTPDLNLIRPESEHLVIDADPSQQAAIVAVLNGSDLILQGPPGTGKSQTIANLIAEAAAVGKKVLFVAQKRAAIDAVVNNLKRRDLAELVLDLHDPKTSRKAVVEQIKTSMERASQEPPPDVAEVNRLLVDRRERSLRHSQVMSDVRQPSGMSIAEMQQWLLALAPERDLGVVLPTQVLNQLPLARMRELADDIMSFVEADGLRWWRGESPWSSARSITGEEQLRATRERLDGLTGAGLDDARRALEELLRTTGLPRPATLGQWSEVIGLMTGVGKTVAAYGPEVFASELDDKRAAVATSAWRKQTGISIGFWRRRTLREEAKADRKESTSRKTVFAELSAAADQRNLWARLTGGQAPRLAAGADELAERYERLRDDLAAIGATIVSGDLADCTEPELDHTLRNLKDDERVLVTLPKLNGQRARYEQLGLAMLLDRLAAQNRTPIEAAEALRFAWLSSWLGELRLAVPDYAGFGAATQDRLIDEFREADTRHVELAAARVRRAVAERQIRARDNWPDQRQIVREQVGRKARHKPIRQLVDDAPELLLAVRPCWAMSPLVVSQVLPARRLFDLVVFDEASQIEPADAIPAIMRGDRLVVAGDNKQLPPTPFFFTAGGDDDEEVEAEGALGDFESILDVLGSYIPTKTLLWHYRSQDERLIAFSNHEIYDDDLVTFPGTIRESSVRHLLVNAVSAPGGRGYAPAEVDRVVELVIEYAEQRPDESLGVIALGRSGADLINKRLQAALAERPDLGTFFDEEVEIGRRFFVKNLENVQGDERDTIILSVGGSRTATGALNHNFGPINQKGGERRLNVAVTRARKALTVVSTFTHYDFVEERLNSRGLRFLRDYLFFASQHGTAARPEPPGSDVSPIEQQIIDRLRNVGVLVHPRYGISGSRIDIAAEHPNKAGQLLLAIEIDSHRYHEPGRSVRERDRLRPQQLERMGWRHQRVWTAEWLRDPESEITKLIKALDSAKRGSDLIDRIDGDRSALRHSGQAAEPDVPAERRLPPPGGILKGVPIQIHPRYVLVDVVHWIDSDGLLRDEEEIIKLMMTELGYKRRSKNIVDRLRAAIRAARAERGR
jgi:hypothetical protein